MAAAAAAGRDSARGATQEAPLLGLRCCGATAGLLAAAAACCCCYWNSLGGEFVHDDVWAIVNNPDVRPDAPLAAAFADDFWGKGMAENTSHKSYRPLCVLSFK